MFGHLVQYVLTGAYRDKLVLSMLAVLIACMSLSIFFGSSSLIEKQQFTLVYTSGALRVSLMLGLILFIVFFIRRSFESKDVEFLLSRPLNRFQLIAAYSSAFSLIALCCALLCGAIVIAVAPNLAGQGHSLWILSLCAEAVIVANAALFFAMVLTSSAAGAMAAIGFYVLSRMMGEILGIMDANLSDKNIVALEWVMQIISVVMPRLDLMGQTSWLIYGADGSMSAVTILLQGGVFTVLLLAACMVDLSRRQF